MLGLALAGPIRLFSKTVFVAHFGNVNCTMRKTIKNLSEKSVKDVERVISKKPLILRID